MAEVYLSLTVIIAAVVVTASLVTYCLADLSQHKRQLRSLDVRLLSLEESCKELDSAIAALDERIDAIHRS